MLCKLMFASIFCNNPDVVCRAWFDKHGPIPYSGDTTLGPIQPRHVVLNHWEQHSKTCKTCREGMKLLKQVEYSCYATGKDGESFLEAVF